MYSVKEVAKELKVHENTIRRWIRDGDLKALKVGKQVRITDEQLKQFLESGKK